MTATERPGDVVRRAALLSIVLSGATAPLLWVAVGWPGVALLLLVAVPGYVTALRQSVRGGVKAASQTFLTVTTLVVAGCVLLTGGFFGWGILLVVNLPMLALLVGIEPWRDALVVVRRVAILVALVYLLPEAPEGTTPDLINSAVDALQQTLDPPGLAARDFRECLLLQIDAKEAEDLDMDLSLQRLLIDLYLKDIEGNR
ncbi:MAG: hypothetical protein AAF602_19025, partial [Myxococcota bacterium]